MRRIGWLVLVAVALANGCAGPRATVQVWCPDVGGSGVGTAATFNFGR